MASDPTDRRWAPTTELELQAALRAGLLSEDLPHLELKRQLGKGAKENIELARDLASLSVYGGLLLVGVVDERQRKSDTPADALEPGALEGEDLRIIQVAEMRVDPPLTVRPVLIRSEANPTLGYIAIHVPLSPLAPHMVDGKYWGRNDKGKRALSEGEVAALYGRRETLTRTARDALHAYVAEDPWRAVGHESRNAHLFLVAEPRSSITPIFLPIIRDEPNPGNWLVQQVLKRQSVFPRFGEAFSPDIDSAMHHRRHADGVALSTWDEMYADEMNEDQVLELAVSERGAVRLFCGRASIKSQATGDSLLSDVAVAGLTWRFVQLVADLGRDVGYGGSWAFGMRVDNTRGCRAFSLCLNSLSTFSYSSDSYEELTMASAEEMEDRPGPVSERLVGRLMRALGTHRSPLILRFIG